MINIGNSPFSSRTFCCSTGHTRLCPISLHTARRRAFLPRTPLIPGITDTDENLEAIAGLYKETGVKKTELLPYNPTWYGKTEKLGVSLADELEGVKSWQSNEKMEHCKNIFRREGIEC